MFIDFNLDWQEHINYTYKKLLKFCGIFYKIRDLLPFPCLKMLYFSFIYTHLIYGIEIYANTYNSYLQKLSILNNKIIRILFNKHTLISTSSSIGILDFDLALCMTLLWVTVWAFCVAG